MKSKKYKLYVLRCGDNSLYTGIALDVAKRFEEHKNRKGAKYTRIKSKHPLKVEVVYEIGSRSEASKVEAFFKKYNKAKKEKVLQNRLLFTQEILENYDFIIKEIVYKETSQ